MCNKKKGEGGGKGEIRMRSVIQRVKEARVTVEGRVVGEIGMGLLVFLGVGGEDGEKDGEQLARRIVNLRVFPDEGGLMNISLKECGGEALVVSQFTLWGDCRRGRRPSFAKAAPPERARGLYEDFVRALRALGVTVAVGQFQAMMEVHSINDGPVTLLLDSSKAF